MSLTAIDFDRRRRHLHAMWDGVAPAWEAHADFIDQRGADVSARMLELVAPSPGEHVLELAGGTGSVGLDAAGAVEPDGQVVVSDISVAMTEVARRRAAALGLANVTTRVLDLERIDEAEASFDVVVCREGLMLVPDPVLAASEIRRVLRPGGRVAIAVWGPRARNPWLGVLFDAMSDLAGAPVPPPGVPEPFSLDDADRLRTVLDAAGLVGVAIEERATPYRAATFAEWFDRTAGLAGPLAERLAALPAPALHGLQERLRTALRRYETPAGYVIEGVSLLAAARRRPA